MKMFILILLTYVSAFAQDLGNNFYISENKIITWQYIHNISITSTQLLNEIEKSGNYTDITAKDDYITCKLRPVQLEPKKYGHSSATSPFYILNYLVNAEVLFEIKEGKYRVTIKNIVFEKNGTDALGTQGQKETFEWWCLKKDGRIKEGHFKKGGDILNKDWMVRTKFDVVLDEW